MICGYCGEDFEGRSGQRFCSRDCKHESQRRPKKDRVWHRLRNQPDHPVAPPCGVVTVARVNLYDKIGGGEHPCHWCGETVRWITGGTPGTPGTLIADHLDWDRANDDPANLVASCNVCNHMRSQTRMRRRIEPGELVVGGEGRSTTRAVERACDNCGSTFLALPANVDRGQALYCSRTCSGQHRSKKVNRDCEQCGTAFTTLPVYIKRGGGRFCSRSCATTHRHAQNRG